MVTPSTFFITLHKFLYNIFLSKIKPATVKENIIYVSLQFFQTPKKSSMDRNINFDHIALIPAITFYAKNWSDGYTSFQTKDSILRQLHFVIMYKYILMRVKIIE